jgi:CheY-like chemotaxis protein
MGKKRILIIDDEAGFTRLLKLTLERAGEFIVKEENDGARALETAKEFRPDLIFLDIVMPKADGGEVAAKLRAEPLLKRTPVVFLTAIVSKQEAQSGDLGGYPFLAKPVSLDSLITCIAEHLPDDE